MGDNLSPAEQVLDYRRAADSRPYMAAPTIHPYTSHNRTQLCIVYVYNITICASVDTSENSLIERIFGSSPLFSDIKKGGPKSAF